MISQKNLTNVIILFLLLVLLFRTCKNPYPTTSPKIIRDTTWIIKDSIIYSKPQVIKVIPASQSKEYYTKEYFPDTNYSKLLLQYNNIVNRLLSSNIIKDSIKIDSIGSVLITDTISDNLIEGRSIATSLKYPIIKETLIVPEKKRNQLYLGFSITGDAITSLNGELLFKNKKDNIFGLSAGICNTGMIYGIKYYTKIKLK